MALPFVRARRLGVFSATPAGFERPTDTPSVAAKKRASRMCPARPALLCGHAAGVPLGLYSQQYQVPIGVSYYWWDEIEMPRRPGRENPLLARLRRPDRAIGIPLPGAKRTCWDSVPRTGFDPERTF